MVEKYYFNSVPEMIRFHLKTQKSLVRSSKVHLTKPIPRQNWELHHQDVELTKKIGEGAFGEVHLGLLRLKNGRKLDVAVKLVCFFN